MKTKEKIQFTIGFGLNLISLIFFIFCTFFVLSSTHLAIGASSLFMMGLILVIPVLIGTTMMSHIRSMRVHRYRIGQSMVYLYTLYYALMLFIVLFKSTSRMANSADLSSRILMNANFIPFKTILEYISAIFNHSMNWQIPVENLAVNIVLLMPLGFLLPLLFKSLNAKKNIIFVLFLVVCILESTQ